MSANKPKEKMETEANSLSVKLLKTLGGGATKDYSKKIITNLKDLSNRIKIANKQHQNKHPNKAIAEEWIREEGVDLTIVKEQAIYTKEEEKKISIRMPIKVEEQPSPLQPAIKDLPFQQFSSKVQQNYAYRAIFESLTEQIKLKKQSQRTTFREKNMKKIVKAHISRLCEHLEPTTRLLDDHKKSEKVSDVETIKAYEDVISQCDSKELSEMIFRRFKQDDHFSKSWIQLLYYQIQMAKQIYDDSVSSKDKSNFKLYISAVSLENLSRLFKAILRKNKAELIGNYKLGQNHSLAEDHWRQLYFMLRTDQKNNFLEECRKIHPELALNYERLFDSIESFEKAPLQITDIALNSHMNFFERVIKQIAEGQYESMFAQAHPSLQALEEPWLILMTLQFRQSGSRFIGIQRKDPMKQATTRYFRSMTQKIFGEQEYNEEAIMHLIVGLLSLGSLKQLFKVYDQLGQYLHSNSLYIDFVHLFVILAANPQLLLCQLPELQASELLRRCLMEIIGYLRFLKNRKLPCFKAYLNTLLHTMTIIQRFLPRFTFQPIIESLSKQLLTTLQDLKLIDKQNLAVLCQSSKVVHTFQRQLIRNIHPVNQKQFITLAQFCTSINQYTLQEQTLIKLIIYNYIQADREEKQIQRGVFGTTAKTNSSALNTDTAQAQLFLQRQMREDKKSILYFLIDLKDLRSAVNNRRKDILRKQEKKFTKYRQNFEDIFEYLIEMDPSFKQGLLNIYLLYIERLEQMYRLITLSSANLEKFYQERSSLADDLNVLKRRYPALHGQTYGRIMGILGR